MISQMSALVDKLNEMDGRIAKLGDPRISGLPLMSTAWHGLIVCLAYLVVVFGGQLVMRSRRPFEIRGFMCAYNFGMVIINGVLVIDLFRYCWLNGYSLRCQAVDTSLNYDAVRQVYLAYAFYFIKLIEFADTFIFVLRKKGSQITFLHVFHHFAVPLSLWYGIKMVPGGHGAFFATINSFVHTVMYAYYGLSALGPAYQKWLWWKSWVTRLQIFQFVAMYAHTAQLFVHNPCGYPLLFAYGMNVYSLLFLILFIDYYAKAIGAKSRSAERTVTPEANGSAVVYKDKSS